MRSIDFGTTVVGLLNGMMGGGCLALPVIGLHHQLFTVVIVCISVGLMSMYTAYLITVHIGQAPSIKEAILFHFDNDHRYLRVYSGLLCLKFIFLCSYLFKLTCLQVTGLMGTQSIWVPVLTLFTFLVLTSVLWTYKIGQETIALGVISFISFICFILWVFITSIGDKSSHVNTEDNPVKLVAMMMTAFTVHAILTQSIIKNHNRHQYTSIVVVTFLIAIAIYIFVTAGGSYGIRNRSSFKSHPQTIQDFFQSGQWQVSFIEWVYLLHLVTAFPYILILSNIRFGQLFDREFDRPMDLWDFFQFACMLGIAFLVYQSDLKLDVILQFYGSVIGFINIIAVPVGLHLYCVHFKRHSGWIRDVDDRNLTICPNPCQCKAIYISQHTQNLETFLLVLLILIGLAMLVYTIMAICSLQN